MPVEKQKESLLRFGVIYGLKYLGGVEIFCSMRDLQFEDRRRITRECIREVCSKSSPDRVKSQNSEFSELVANGMLASSVDLFLSGMDVLLTISVEVLKVVRKDTRQTILTHKMEMVSFASGGDGNTLDCIAYVAKDESDKRVCYVLQSLSGLAAMIISTIGQAFDLKYADSMKLNNNNNNNDNDEEEGEANNDQHPRAKPGMSPAASSSVGIAAEHTTTNNNNNSNSSKFKSSTDGSNDRDKAFDLHAPIPLRPKKSHGDQGSSSSRSTAADNLESELWFHGNISRSQAESLLRHDGDFLVRECSQIPGQYVLSGRYANHARHLLLVDPQGVVRTRGYTFDSISHLIYHHQQKKISIVSPDSELLLVNPIIRSTKKN